MEAMLRRKLDEEKMKLERSGEVTAGESKVHLREQELMGKLCWVG